MTKILELFNMLETNPVNSVLPTNCKLNARQYPKREKDKAEMWKVSYASAISYLMYADT